MNDELNFEQRMAHLKAGYENSQSVVRFIDTKVGVLLAGSTAITGGLLGYSKSMVGKLNTFHVNTEGWSGCWACLPFFLLISGIALLVSLGYVFWQSKQTLMPRDTGSSKASAIFPYLDLTNQVVHDKGKERIDFFRSGGNEQEAIEDWANQLQRMGEINCEKIKHCKLAFQGFFVFLVVSLPYLLLCFFFNYAIQK